MKSLQDNFICDVLVIGSGASGLVYADIFTEECLKNNYNYKIALITKAEIKDSNTYFAQGGIATPTEDTDINSHIKDTLQAGVCCNQNIVENIISSARNCINYLKDSGMEFDLDKNNNFHYGYEGGHSKRRIVHHKDTTGKNLIDSIWNKIKKNNINTIRNNKTFFVFEKHIAISLITNNNLNNSNLLLDTENFLSSKASHSIDNEEIVGAYVLNNETNQISIIRANVIIIATGGAGKVYKYTTNQKNATGDGIAMADKLGLKIKNMEFYQFHPTLLYHAKVNNFLLTEALRGEGAKLRSPIDGKRFMRKFSPKKMEMDTRDIIARSIFTEMETENLEYVYLDIRHRARKFLIERFPGVYTKLESLNIDMKNDLIKTVPAAHYMCGGIETSINGETRIKGLYAIGEVACTEFHGANRLASNSLLECVYMGIHAAYASIKYLNALEEKNYFNLIKLKKMKKCATEMLVNTRRVSQLNANWIGLRNEMSAYAGIVRTKEGLDDQIALLKIRKSIIDDYYKKYKITSELIELNNILLVAKIITESALNNSKSIGSHYREDSAFS